LSFLSIVPTIPPSSLRDLYFLLLLVPLTVRIYMLTSPLNKARIQLRGQIKDTVSSLKSLKIPGMKRFLIRESILLTFPYVFAIVIFWKVPLSKISLTELGLNTTILTALGLIVWSLVDIQHSRNANQFLNELLNSIIEFETKLETFQISISVGLSILVGWKMGLTKVARKIGSRLGRKFAKEKLDSEEVSSAFPGAKVLVDVLDAVDTIIDAPRKLIRTGIDIAVRKFDSTLESHFQRFTKRGYSDVAMTVFWGLFPLTWLLIIIYLIPILTG